MMDEQDNGGAAFPRQFQHWDNDVGEYQPSEPEEGMTLRDYFAAKAMPVVWHAFDEGYTGSINVDAFDSDALAKHAYQIADAMLKARKQ